MLMELEPALVGQARNLAANAGTENNCTTWEITGTRRRSDGSSLMGTHAITWKREHLASPGAAAPPCANDGRRYLDHVVITDARLECIVALPRVARVSAQLDVYNLTIANPVHFLTRGSGASVLRPTSVVSCRRASCAST